MLYHCVCYQKYQDNDTAQRTCHNIISRSPIQAIAQEGAISAQVAALTGINARIYRSQVIQTQHCMQHCMLTISIDCIDYVPGVTVISVSQ